jgi:DNA-binding transcriptional regulator YdaS (Cro superfamily)
MEKQVSALQEAIDAVGGVRALGEKLNISHQAISQWKQCPPLRVLDLERISGIPRHRLRPDLYPPEEPKKQKRTAQVI